MSDDVTEDKRQLITIYMIADGRTKYHSVHCWYCGQKIGSLEGGRVYGMSDVTDVSDYPDNPKLTIYCNGKFCRTYYRMVLR